MEAVRTRDEALRRFRLAKQRKQSLADQIIDEMKRQYKEETGMDAISSAIL